MNKKRIIITIIIIAILGAALTHYFTKNPSPAKIYSNSANNIVELKAQNDDDLVGYGTAELINSNGEFVTNAHVVIYTTMGIAQEFNNYYIRFSFEDAYREVELIRYDLSLDLAILKFKELPNFRLHPIKFGNSAKLKSGDKIYAIGNSQNLGISISQGIIGIPLIEIEYSGQKRSVIQCDLTITEGNSGGALLDEKGNLVGITTFRIKDNKGNVIYGIAYSIPVDIVKQFISQ